MAPTLRRARRSITVIVCALALGAPPVATAEPSVEKQSAVGAGSYSIPGFGPQHFAFAAQRTPSGKAAGYIVADFANGSTGETETVRAAVLCVSVIGNKAAVVGEITSADPPFGSNLLVLIAEDNGNPGEGLVPDRIGEGVVFQPILPPDPSQLCDAFFGFGAPFPVERGNIVIRS
jgi:hypothetical protein